MTEKEVIEQLSQYRQKQARIKVLSTYSVGAGITVSRLNQDDQLQELHAKLRNMPSYMYLTPYEQKLETVAHAHMTDYPAGTKAQLNAVPAYVMDEGDQTLLQDVRQKIKKVIAARGYEVRDDIDQVIERVTELQDLEFDLQRLDFILDRLQDYKPKEASLLRLLYVEGLDLAEIAEKLQVTEKTITRRRAVAEDSYIKLAR